MLKFPSELTHFKTPKWLIRLNIRNWLISRPQYCALFLTHFKTLMFLIQTELSDGCPAVNCINHHPRYSFQDPHIGKQQRLNLHRRLPSIDIAKISMGDYLQWQTSNPLLQWNSNFFVKTRRKTHHVHLINSSQDASSVPPAFGTTVFAKHSSFNNCPFKGMYIRF